jgi:hypothetical protein
MTKSIREMSKEELEKELARSRRETTKLELIIAIGDHLSAKEQGKSRLGKTEEELINELGEYISKHMIKYNMQKNELESVWPFWSDYCAATKTNEWLLDDEDFPAIRRAVEAG